MRKFIYIILAGIVIVTIVGYKLYNKPHRSVQEERSIKVEANELFAEFESDEAKANLLYLDKVVEVSGSVSESLTNQDGQIVLVLKTSDPLFGISCTMARGANDILSEDRVTIKGICTGYLSDVVVTNGILIE